MTHITIIGGGIAGLATAFYLQQKSCAAGTPVEYTLVEQAAQFGGKITTVTEGNFVIEGGPDSFITPKPWALQLCRELGLDERLIPTNDDRRNIYVLQKGKLIPFPGGFRLTVPTEFVPFALSPLISPLGKLRMGLDLVIPPRPANGDESLADFIRRRLGEEAVDKIAGPMMAGIYSADPEKLSINSTFPMFVAMEQKHGSLIKAMRSAKSRRPVPKPNGNEAKAPAMFTSLRGGMTELVESLESRLEGDLRPGCTVTGISPTPTGFEVTLDGAEPITTDGVVLAIPAYSAAKLVEPFDADLAHKLRQIRYASTGNISLGYRRADVTGRELDGFGFMVPRSEGRPIAACTWTSTKFDHRAADEDILLRVFIGGDGRSDQIAYSDEALLKLARRQIAEIMGITAEPVIHKIFRWPRGNPQYDVGHLERVEAIEQQAARTPGLHLTGSPYRGIGLPDCVKSALSTVDALLGQLVPT